MLLRCSAVITTVGSLLWFCTLVTKAAPYVWVSISSMKSDRAHFVAESGADGRIYTFGGETLAGAIATGEAYSSRSNSWTSVTPMPTARLLVAGAKDASGRIYAIGGYNNGLVANTVEAYTISTNSWATLPHMPTARYALSATLGPNGLIYTFGGIDSNGRRMATVEAYNPSTGLWSCSTGDSGSGCHNTSVTPMPYGLSDFAVVTGLDGLIYVIGGADANGNPLNRVVAYSPRTNTWIVCASMPTSRLALAATVGANGVIYAVGGNNFSGYLTTNEAYNPSTNTWTTKAPMSVPRHGPGVVRGSDGRIYAIGGEHPSATGGYQYLNSAEVYTP